MGSADGRDDEQPVHCVWVDEFKMARYQVTNRDYQLFLEDTKRRLPPFWAQPEFSHPDQPVVPDQLNAALLFPLSSYFPLA